MYFNGAHCKRFHYGMRIFRKPRTALSNQAACGPILDHESAYIITQKVLLYPPQH